MTRRLIVEWPDASVASTDVVALTRTALSDAAKATGVNEPAVAEVVETGTVYRDSADGEYVTKAYADTHPGTTTSEPGERRE